MHLRELIKGTTVTIILRLLEEHKEMYGYELAQMVKDLTDGKILMKEGSLYPALHKMTKDGVISYRSETVNGRNRKYYFITPKGEKVSKESKYELKQFMDVIDEIIFGNPFPKLQ